MTTRRPLTFDLVRTDSGWHVRVRAAGNRAIILQSESYTTKRAAADAVGAIIHAVMLDYAGPGPGFVSRDIDERTTP